MFKSLVGHGHVDFSTNQQQDAQEYFLHLMDLLEKTTSLKELFEFQVIADLSWFYWNGKKHHITYVTWRRSLSYRNHSIDLQSKSVDWPLCDRDLRHEKS